jgi:hypothetical protein
MVFDDELVAVGDLLRGAQELEMPMLQDVSFVGTKVAAFAFAHPASLKSFAEDVPKNPSIS